MNNALNSMAQVRIMYNVSFHYSHNDLAHVYRKRVENRVDQIDLTSDVTPQWGDSHTDIPRLREGLVGTQVSLDFYSLF